MNYLLTGHPGVGKTTIIKKLIEKLKLPAGGFYTEEIREDNMRTGFAIVTLSGLKGVLAHRNFKSRYKVGDYGVGVYTLDKIGVKEIQMCLVEKKAIVIDEIGKMELLSPEFQEAVKKALDADNLVLGTITLARHPFAEKVKARDDVKIYEVTRENQDHVLKTLTKELKKAL
ncbi:MAG: NTPase [candidate division Zixibacteria bacterium]|nr:NTPase [candidate division Zixibacteria bacterium]